jgi:hypothetical protein
MDIQTEKLHLIEQLAKLQDVNVIKKVKALLQKSLSEKIVGSTPQGDSIDAQQVIMRAKSSESAINRGDIVSIESLEEESKTW